ncbi:serine/threonine-protein kinase ATG1t [Citrus sinensis]|uniref:Serine/threonine-protein kinase ATG1t n=1 Tax=Citrus sinensis TaxID=2711 RepID=A0ACB8JJC9_CITSI|nr:serine/threonine-protein kinase ATG1t [Citrus sinensis]
MEQNKLSKYKTVGDYALKSKIGESSNSLSTVWKAEHLSSGDVVAVKQVYVEKLNKHLKSCLDCELNFLSSVNHPNIIRLFDAFQAENCIFLVVEFCAGGNLSSYIRLHGRVPEQTARKFLQQLGSSLPAFGAGLEILNSHHIIHRDLKPENILLSGLDDDVMLKIADFGLSCTLYPGNYAEKVCGSPLYMAPEVLQFQRYDEKVDMWSVGAILFELLNGYPPFSGRNNVQLIVPALHPDCVDMCLKLLSANTVIPYSLLNSLQWIVRHLDLQSKQLYFLKDWLTKFLLKSQSLICRTQIQIGLKMSAMSWVASKVTVKSLPLLILVGGGDVVEQ